MRWIVEGSRLAWLAAALCVPGLSGCGQAGDLYLPQPEPAPTAEQTPATAPPSTDRPEPAEADAPGEPTGRADTTEGPQEDPQEDPQNDADLQDTPAPPDADRP